MSFCVKISDETSEITYMSAGEPQGSVLGPIFYTILTSDIPENAYVLIGTYADNTVLLSSSQTLIEATNLAQEELHKIHT